MESADQVTYVLGSLVDEPRREHRVEDPAVQRRVDGVRHEEVKACIVHGTVWSRQGPLLHPLVQVAHLQIGLANREGLTVGYGVPSREEDRIEIHHHEFRVGEPVVQLVGEAARPGTHHQRASGTPALQDPFCQGQCPLVLAVRLRRPSPVPVEVWQVVKRCRHPVGLAADVAPGRGRQIRLENGADIGQLSGDALDQGPATLPGGRQKVCRPKLLPEVLNYPLHLFLEPGELAPARREVVMWLGNEHRNGPQPGVYLPALPASDGLWSQVDRRGAQGTTDRIQQTA